MVAAPLRHLRYPVMAILPSHQRAWKHAPFIRLVTPLAAGILCQEMLPVTASVLACSAVATLGLLLVYEKKINYDRYRQSWVPGACLHLLLLFLGRGLFLAQTDPPTAGRTAVPFQPTATRIITLESGPVVKTKNRVAEATLDWLITDTQCRYLHERVLVYFPKDSGSLSLNENDQLLCRGPLRPIENNPEPGSFDFKTFCARKQIHARLFIRTGDFRVIGQRRAFLRAWLNQCRSGIVSLIRRYIHAPDAAGLLEALLVGYSQDLDRSLVADYSSTGVVHIIAISGLHLALIYSLLQFLLHKIGDHGIAGWIKTGLILTALWLFSLLCGASPSVLRSAIMLTLTLSGRRMQRQLTGLNGLSAAAFLLLSFNPGWLWDLGFQLSFLAVLSLLLFARRLQVVIPVKNKILAALWKAASVSIAAQLLTTPVCLFYFHQFPNYFLPTNLIAVPLSSAVLLLGILTCSLAWYPPLADMAGSICTASIHLLDGCIRYFSKLPHAVWHTGIFSLGELMVLYAMIGCAARWLEQKKTGWLLAFLALCLLLALISFCGKFGLV